MGDKSDVTDLGPATRRAVLGDAHVDAIAAASTEFDADFQRFITEAAWKLVWSRPGLTKRERSLITIALLASGGHDDELARHVSATRIQAQLRKTSGNRCCTWRSMPASPRRTRRSGLRKRSSPSGTRHEHDRFAESAFYPRDRDWHPPALAPAYRSTILRSPRQTPVKFATTKSELTGPVFGHHRLGPLDNDLIRNLGAGVQEAVGQRLIVHGRVLDQNSRPVSGALIEIWQANAGGVIDTNEIPTAQLLIPALGVVGE